MGEDDPWFERRTVPAITTLLVDLHDYFAEFNDDPGAVFGEYARVVHDPEAGTVTVCHETEPWGVRLTIEPIKPTGE